ncbi:thiamine phosphate synthase [Paenibacillus massiliensis]|uniref:thiamine phosphate synthase n=1 Tax=Paenibacillus massiliensis TaxID=225917 RepID=UPI00048C79C9|nr:thiamine phosphate synthase [Paenibacillus massiliensis]
MKWSKQALRSSMLLYAITDRRWLQGRSLALVTEEVLQNGATFLQLREKELPFKEFLAEAIELRRLAQQYHIPFVVNDNIEVALECGADGVHVGQSDIVGKDVRSLIGPDKILGISANGVASAKDAEAAGADYIGVGAVFNTTTKNDAEYLSIADVQEIVDAVSIPVVAIGGIDDTNVLQLSCSGVDGVAIISAIFAQRNPGAATAHLLQLAQQMISQRS